MCIKVFLFSFIYSWEVDKLDLEVAGVLTQWTFYVRPGSNLKATSVKNGTIVNSTVSSQGQEQQGLEFESNQENELMYINQKNR